MKHNGDHQDSRSPVVRRILVPLDFSASGRGALNYATLLAREMRAKIVLLHVVEPAYAGPEPALAYIPISTDAQARAGKKRLREMARDFIPAACFDTVAIRTGSPYHEITSAARELGADLIVISTHGRTGLSHVLMGSTAERVVRHAHCPVLTVRITNTPAPGRILPKANSRRPHRLKNFVRAVSGRNQT